MKRREGDLPVVVSAKKLKEEDELKEKQKYQQYKRDNKNNSRGGHSNNFRNNYNNNNDNKRNFKKKWGNRDSGKSRDNRDNDRATRRYEHDGVDFFNDDVRNLVLKDQVSEKDVGIEAFVNTSEPCTGIFRHRYSDFLVNELDCDDKAITFTDFKNPGIGNEDDGEKNWKILEDIVGTSLVEKLKELKEKNEPESFVTLEHIEEKTDRTQVFDLVHTFFPNSNAKHVKNEQEKSVIQIYNCTESEKKDERQNQRRRKIKNTDPEDICQFYLYKENIDTMQAISLLARYSRTSIPYFQYAGVKDKRGITVQRITAKGVGSHNLIAAGEQITNLKVGHFSFVKEPLKLGKLGGNRFYIVLREFKGNKENITSSLSSLQSTGFINYFGMQRFGSTSVPTYRIGQCLLKRNFKMASALILIPRPGEQADVGSARKFFEKNPTQFGKAIELFPKRYSAEISILRSLSHGNDYETAISKIPRNLQLMYPHSYQSYLFNKAVSARIEKYGLKIVEGDIIVLDENSDSSLEFEIHPKDRGNTKVHFVTKEEAECGKFSINELKLTVPGYCCFFPKNDIKDVYTNILKSHELSMESFGSEGMYTLPGSYRSVIIPVYNLEWDFIKYNDADEVLTCSDLDKSEGRSLPTGTPDGTYEALRVGFELKAAAYATMVVREIMKMDSSMKFHADISQSRKEEEDIKKIEF